MINEENDRLKKDTQREIQKHKIRIAKKENQNKQTK